MGTVIDKGMKIEFRKSRGRSRGRQTDSQALQEVRKLLGNSIFIPLSMTVPITYF
jgi:hypothetical protein